MATQDVLTLAAATQAVAAGPHDSDVLGSWITAISARLDQLCGPIVQRTITDELHDGGFPDIRLNGPVTSISSIVEDQPGGLVTVTHRTFGTAPADGYVLERWQTDTAPYSGYVTRWSYRTPALWQPGDSTVKATYVAGRFATTAAVTPLFTRAAVLMLKHVWQSHQLSVAKVGAYDVPAAAYPLEMVPKAVTTMLADEMVTRGQS